MKSLLLNSAQAAEADDLELIEKLIDEAAMSQRSVIDDIVDSKMVSEEDFLAGLAGELDIEWIDELKPRKTRRLKEVCSAQVALKYRLLPVALGDDFGGEDGEGEPVDGPVEQDPASSDVEADSEVVPLSLVTYDPFNLLARAGGCADDRPADPVEDGFADPDIEGDSETLWCRCRYV